MIANRLSHHAVLTPVIAHPVPRSDRRVGVPLPASLPRRRQAVGRGARVPAFLANLLHLESSSPVHSKCTGDHPRCRTTIPSVRKNIPMAKS